MANELKPCPFCGGEAVLRLQGNVYTKSRKLTVKCKDCRVELTHAAIHHGFDWLAEKIERDWNRRALESASQPGSGETVAWRRKAYPDDVRVTKVERDAWLEEGWEVEALLIAAPSAGNSEAKGDGNG